jgi:two-component system chemotaxis response regulator CheB
VIEQSAVPTAQRDVVVVGASAGGVEALIALMADLPPELPAAVFVVLHVMADGTSVLPEILDRAGRLPVTAARDGERFERGHVYVAPPDRHMLIADGAIALTRGPRENGHRPAIDPLFRSAARAHGPRVVAMILSGMLDDGVMGMRIVKQRGGAALVQDPADALHPAMPANALEHVEADVVAPVAELGRELCEVLDAPYDPAAVEASAWPSDDLALDTVVDPTPPGRAAGLICPQCGGALWERDEGGLARYECRVGHAFGAESLAADQARALEESLWSALQSLEERADLMARMARRAPERSQRRYELRADAARHHATVLRDTLAALARSPADPGRPFDGDAEPIK